MNSLQTRDTCQISFDIPQDQIESFQQASPQMKKLMEFLQSHPATDFSDRLRSQVYIPKNVKGTQKNEPLKKFISPNKTAQILNSNDKNKQKSVHFADKPAVKERKGFFSPKTTKVYKENNETPNPNFISLQLSKEYLKSLKKPFSFLNKQQKYQRQVFQSEKQINYRNTVAECPDFLKKGLKTAKSIDNAERLSMGDFTIFKTLGQGTFGDVLAAIHHQSGFICTIKRYKKEIIKSHELQDKFIHDIKVQMKMSHPHIVKLYGFFDDIVYFYMVFEYMESGSLVKTIQEKGGKLPEVEVFRKVFEINQAILYLHEQNIIHRDIKPASVLTCLNVCKLCDTQWIQQNSNTPQHITLCKELDYMPPEAIQGKQISAEFDIWGLGLIAFELLKGKKMIEGNTQKILIRKIISLKKQLIQMMLPRECSENLKSFILSTLEPVPSKRIKSSEINKMKIQKQKQQVKICLTNKNLPLHERVISITQKYSATQRKGSPKHLSIFGVKKEIKNEFSTLL